MNATNFEKFKAEFYAYLSDAMLTFQEVESVSRSFMARPMQRHKTDYSNELVAEWASERMVTPTGANRLLSLVTSQIKFYQRVTLGRSIMNFGRVAYIDVNNQQTFQDLQSRLLRLSQRALKVQKSVNRWEESYW
ncbi:hypothetical protein T5B8_00150 [Salinisphaera sp. T5B8]|uniref:hypothetical protein n=1 Tax=Salinisphaera sp. T5B8 TaxID=1304154 RepID=UPI0033428468